MKQSKFETIMIFAMLTLMAFSTTIAISGLVMLNGNQLILNALK